MGKQKILNSNQLKIIAILAMTVDHIAWAVFPGYPVEALPLIMHIIGRLTCPIMCYFIVEGYHYTKNINKYTARLFAFSVMSHFAYVFASDGFIDAKSFIPFYYGDILNQTSVMWSLAWGLIMLRAVNSEKLKTPVKVITVIIVCLVTLPSDWSCIVALCITAMGINRGDFKKQMMWMMFYINLYVIVYFFAIDAAYGILQLCTLLSIPLLSMYNGKRGSSPKINKLMKWLFYIYYPLHLAIIGIMKRHF